MIGQTRYGRFPTRVKSSDPARMKVGALHRVRYRRDVTNAPLRIEPAADVLDASRRWLSPVREALEGSFLSAYLTGSVLVQGFSVERQRINILIVARSLDGDTLDHVAAAIPSSKRPPHFDPLFLTHDQIVASLDVFPIEFLEIQECHLRLEGADVLGAITVPRRHLRLQCEQELRGKHLRLRQEYLAAGHDAKRLQHALDALASSFHTQFRTLLRLQGEPVPASLERVIDRIAQLHRVDAAALLGPHLVRHSDDTLKEAEVRDRYRRFLSAIESLIGAIDGLQLK